MNFIETSLFYFLVVLLSAALARMSENGKSKAGLVAAVVLLTAVGGLRSYAVGQDTLGYKEGIEYFYAYGTTMWNHTVSSQVRCSISVTITRSCSSSSR